MTASSITTDVLLCSTVSRAHRGFGGQLQGAQRRCRVGDERTAARGRPPPFAADVVEEQAHERVGGESVVDEPVVRAAPRARERRAFERGVCWGGPT